MLKETILTNAVVVAPEETFSGTVVMSGGIIKQVDAGRSQAPGCLDLEGDFLLPGLIEPHTDNLERFMLPRPKVKWPTSLTAFLAHDALIAAAGITTVLDSVFLGSHDPIGERLHIVNESLEAIRMVRRLGLTRSQHFLHLRCELPDIEMPPLFERYCRDPHLKLVSLNDHTPGQRQWRDMESFRAYYRADHLSEEQIQKVIEKRQELQRKNLQANKKLVLDACRELKVALASHDDTTEEHILESHADGVTITEFPTTFEAALKSREMGLKNVCGGPNLVRGRSHSANISARELAAHDLLDVISSDYYPSGLLEAVFIPKNQLNYPLPRAVATVTSTPADMVGLSDRGRILTGKKADLIQVKMSGDLPLVIHTWQDGEQRF